ncbi:MAG: hypothetical protein KAI66_07470, partial [Lentisphaeria bacterium]|nr:hypothetical protein [Lentisphaeria bacterium]
LRHGLVIALLTASWISAEEVKAKGIGKGKGAPQTTCPVMGGKINKKLYADVGGKRIYVCCAGCIPAIKKDPAKYVKKLEAAGVLLADVPSTHKNKSGDAHKHGAGHKH